MTRFPTTLLFFGLALVALAGEAKAEEEEKAPTRTSFFNENWLDAVVSIEFETGKDENEKPVFKPIGTGFLVASPKDKSAVLITVGHVLRPADGSKRPREKLRYRRSDLDGEAAIVLDKQLSKSHGGWTFSKSADLAARRFGWTNVKAPPTIPTSHFIDMDLLDVGAPLLVLGFPTGLRSTTHKDPIARRGTVARYGPEGLLAEAFVFPGNSGGPVVYVPHLKVSGPIKSPLVNEEQLVGVVSAYVPYQEQAVSPQTGRTRIIFEENSGLSEVIPVTELEKLLASMP